MHRRSLPPNPLRLRLYLRLGEGRNSSSPKYSCNRDFTLWPISKGHEDDFNGSSALIEKLAHSLSSHLFVPSLPSSVKSAVLTRKFLS